MYLKVRVAYRDGNGDITPDVGTININLGYEGVDGSDRLVQRAKLALSKGVKYLFARDMWY